VSQGDSAKKTRTQEAEKDSQSLVADLLRRVTSPEVLAGVAGAAAAAHFTKHAVDQRDDDEPNAEAAATETDARQEGPDNESDEVAEDESAEEPEDESPEDSEDESEDDSEEEPEDESVEQPEDESGEVPEDESGDDEAASDDAPQSRNGKRDQSQGVDGSLGIDDDSTKLLSRAREYALQLTGHSVESFSGLAREEEGWRIGMEIVEVSRVPSTTDVLASYEVVLNGDGELVDFRRAGRYYRNATDSGSG
jgi:Gas vesicle synthesis protein GvpO